MCRRGAEEDTTAARLKQESSSSQHPARPWLGSSLVTASKDLGVSALAAALAHVLHHPLYTLKSQMMYYGPQFSHRKFLKRAWMEKTFLYRGVISRVLGVMPEKAFKMQGWVIVGGIMESRYKDSPLSKWVVGGAAAGALTALIGGPSERAMVLAQIRKQAFLEVLRHTGLPGLYVGFSTTLYRDISFNVVFFPSREIFVRLFTSRCGRSPDAWDRVLLGYPSGVMAAVVSCPYDVVKTRMQGTELDAKSTTCSRLMLSIVRTEGVQSLFKGLAPRLVVVPSMLSWMYVLNEELEKLLLGTTKTVM